MPIIATKIDNMSKITIQSRQTGKFAAFVDSMIEPLQSGETVIIYGLQERCEIVVSLLALKNIYVDIVEKSETSYTIRKKDKTDFCANCGDNPFYSPKGSDDWFCSEECEQEYNGGEDTLGM